MLSDGADNYWVTTEMWVFNDGSTDSGSCSKILHDCWDHVILTYNFRFLSTFLKPVLSKSPRISDLQLQLTHLSTLQAITIDWQTLQRQQAHFTVFPGFVSQFCAVEHEKLYILSQISAPQWLCFCWMFHDIKAPDTQQKQFLSVTVAANWRSCLEWGNLLLHVH